MKFFPKKYTKEEFIKFLKENGISDKIIAKFVELPENIFYRGNTYELYINATWYDIGKKYYTFELNYYSEDQIEFLFNLKVFQDVELSINNTLCDLMNIKLIKRNHQK